MTNATTEPSRGVMFVATGEKYARSATRCAWSVKKHNPGLGIHLFTDEEFATRLQTSGEKNPFSSFEAIKDPHRRSKVDYISRSPFEQTLYLDSDTEVLTDIREMFGLLERFDIAMAHAMKRNVFKNQVNWKRALPAAYPQYNSGVILYRMSPSVSAFFEAWQKAYIEAGFKIDQISLREVLWDSELSIATLPPEYNLRYMKYKYIWSELEAQPKILHLPRYHRTPKQWLISPFYRLWKSAKYYGAKIKKQWSKK